MLCSLTGETIRGGGEGVVDNVMVGNSAFGVVDRDRATDDGTEGGRGTAVGSRGPESPS